VITILVLLFALTTLLSIIFYKRSKKFEDGIALLKMQVLELSRKRTDFVANVSHELKTPLTSIQGFAETLKNGALEDSEKATQFLDKILDHTERLDRLIHDILDLSRLEATDEHLSTEQIPMDEFLKSLRELFALRLEQKSQSLVIDNEVKELRADRHLLEQAFSNLIANAHRYCHEGAIIEVRGYYHPEAGGSVAIFEVIDNGPGISASDLPRIFERFYRADKSRNRAFGGTGLGLAIVKHIVMSHGGRVAAFNNTQGGMRFQMTFPEAKK